MSLLDISAKTEKYYGLTKETLLSNKDRLSVLILVVCKHNTERYTRPGENVE